jgi:rhodanese-related sulfurtransferase
MSLFHRSKSFTPAEAAAAHGRGELQIVDVREAAELAEASVHGAIHIPLRQLGGRLGELDGRPVAFLCRSGSRSALATRAASRAGLDAANVSGGIVAWSRAGLPVTSRGVA